MRLPQPDDLRDLPMVEKPASRGVVAWVTFAFLRLGRWLGNEWAATVLDRFTQVIVGTIYYPPGKLPSASLHGHESVHDWQARTEGRVRYTLRYALSRKRRQHYEAMAYGYEVAVHGRDAEERAGVAADPVYRMGWSRAEARALIDSYADQFREEWGL